jgi:hypothetical protein
LTATIQKTVPADVADVVSRMQAMLASLPARDGVACFMRLYLTVTQNVQVQLAAATFDDPGFLVDLDRRFAELFFAACGGPPAPAWRPLFDARSRRGIAPIQFALAGMNAHINRDLPVALVAACEHAGIEPYDGSPQHRDYLRVNGMLAAVESTIKERYLTGWLHSLDRLVHPVHRLDDVVAMWDIARARDAAWTNGEALWALRATPSIYTSYLDGLDRSVGLAGRGLLTPADTWLGKVRRLLD